MSRKITAPFQSVDIHNRTGRGDGVTHSLKLHGISNGLANVMIEIRNDLLATPDDEAIMAEELFQLVCPALETLGFEDPRWGGERDA